MPPHDLLGDRELVAQEVEPTDPQTGHLAPPQPEHGTEEGHRPVGAEALGQVGQLLGGDEVRIDRLGRREPSAPARGPGDEIPLHGERHHRSQHAEVALHRARRVRCGVLVDPPLHRRSVDPPDRHLGEVGEQVQPQGHLVPHPGRLPLGRVRLEPLRSDVLERDARLPWVDPLTSGPVGQLGRLVRLRLGLRSERARPLPAIGRAQPDLVADLTGAGRPTFDHGEAPVPSRWTEGTI